MKRANYYAIAPDAVKAMAGVQAYLHQDKHISRQLVNLTFLRVSQLNGCAYCIDLHSRDLLKEGMSVDKLLLVPVWEEVTHLFSEREQAALRWAEVVTAVGETRVPDLDYEAAASVLSPEELVDLTVAVSIMNAFNRMGIAFRLRPAAKG